MVEHRDVFKLPHLPGQNGFDVFPVDLNVLFPTGDVVSLGILLDHQAHGFQIRCGFVKLLGHGQDQVIPDDALRVPADKLQIVLGGLPLGNVGVDGVDPSGQTAAALDVGLLHHQNAQVRAAVMAA